MILLSISILIGVLYFIIISLFIAGFIKNKAFIVDEDKDKKVISDIISVIIPFKNEEKNLPKLIENLKKQTLHKDVFEIILVNDSSTDHSFEIVKEFIKNESNFKLVSSNSNDPGKKKALQTGINASKNDFIITSDADCIHSKTWLETIYQFYIKFKPKMIIAPVIMYGAGHSGQLQALEFMSLTASTAGSAGICSPIMCNGANLAFDKNAYNELEDAFYDKEISGDDIFLLHNFKKKYLKEILYLKSNQASVYTHSELTLKSFLRQRIRWVSKAGSYKDSFTILTSLVVLLSNLLILFTGILSILNTEVIFPFIFLLSLKFIADFIILSISSHFFKQINLLRYFPVTIILYPVYIVITAIWGLFSKTIKWKE